jgi:hypothetical protein
LREVHESQRRRKGKKKYKSGADRREFVWAEDYCHGVPARADERQQGMRVFEKGNPNKSRGGEKQSGHCNKSGRK